MASRQTTFVVDERTERAIDELKEKFHAKSNADVIRKALALARVAAQMSGSGDVITVLDENQNPHTIHLAL